MTINVNGASNILFILCLCVKKKHKKEKSDNHFDLSLFDNGFKDNLEMFGALTHSFFGFCVGVLALVELFCHFLIVELLSYCEMGSFQRVSVTEMSLYFPIVNDVEKPVGSIKRRSLLLNCVNIIEGFTRCTRNTQPETLNPKV